MPRRRNRQNTYVGDFHSYSRKHRRGGYRKLIVRVNPSQNKSDILRRKAQSLFELTPTSLRYDTSGCLRKQIGWKEENKQAIWTEIVRHKIYQQMLVLQERGLKRTIGYVVLIISKNLKATTLQIVKDMPQKCISTPYSATILLVKRKPTLTPLWTTDTAFCFQRLIGMCPRADIRPIWV